MIRPYGCFLADDDGVPPMGCAQAMTNMLQPSSPESLGKALRALREEAGLDIEILIEETKVSRRFFESLETGRYHLLPEKVFCRNFLRQYLQMIGSDDSSWLQEFDQAWDHFEMSSGAFNILAVEELPKRGFNWRLWMPVITGTVVILGLLTVVVLSSSSRVDLPPDPRRSSAQRLIPTRTMSTPTPFAIQSSFEPIEATETETMVKAIIRVEENGECWIHYRDREGTTGQELLFGGTSRELVLAGPALLTLGNAKAASIIVGGREYSDFGRPGQVAHFQVGASSLILLERGSNGS
ncbi:MAG: hypothetical protein DRJ65_12390 [Acidobacteria bacterium]|nr:MAG: hypothetical protein DRJ65_12390 [Acidobacteriota bacterium]